MNGAKRAVKDGVTREMHVADDGKVLFSIAQLAKEFDIPRPTARKRIGGARPSGEIRKNAAYTIATVAKQLLGFQMDAEPSGDSKVDVENLKPFDRDKWYASEQRRLAYEREIGELVPVEQVREVQSQIIKTFLQCLEAMPELLENRAALTPKQVMAFEDLIDAERRRLYAEFTDGVDDE